MTESRATDAPTATGGGAEWSLVVLLGALSAFAPLAIDMYLPAFPAIARELGVELGAVEFTLSAFLAGMAAGQLIHGPLADRWGRRAPLLLGAAVFAVAAIFCARAQGIGALLGGRLVMALGGSAGVVVARTVVRDRFAPQDAARVFAQLMLVMGAAPILAPLLGGQLLRLTGWRGIFWVLAAFGAACVATVALGLRESLPVERRARGGLGGMLRTYGALLKNREFMGHTLATAGASGVLFAYITGAASVFIGQHGVSPQRFGLIFGGNAIGIIAASQLNRRWLRTRSLRGLLGRACAALALLGGPLAIAGATGWGGLAVLWPLLFAALVTLGAIFPNAAALALAPFGAAAGSASSLLGTAQYAIGSAAGATVGLLHDGTARPMTMVIATCAITGWWALRTLAPEPAAA